MDLSHNIQEKTKWQQKSEAFRQAIKSAKKSKQIQKPNGYEQQNINQEQETIQQELFECRKGCGRKFNSQSRLRHEAICVKVFQQKRHEFNSQIKRIDIHTLVYIRQNQVMINKYKDDYDTSNLPYVNGSVSLLKSSIFK